jgi:hypothetical protein
MAKEETVQLSEAQVIKMLTMRKGQFASAAKKARPTGIISDEEILEKLGIGPNETKVFSANVNNIRQYLAKNEAGRLAFNFAYTINSDDTSCNGVTVRNNFIIEDSGNRTAEQVVDEIMYELQGLGEHTDAYKDIIGEAVKACAKHTKEKTEVRLSIKHYVGKTGKHGMNIRANPVVTNDDLPPDETSEEVEEAAVDAVEGESEFNPSDWIGVKIRYKFVGDGESYPEGEYDLTIKSYDEDSTSFICEDEHGEEWAGDYAVNAFEADYSPVEE